MEQSRRNALEDTGEAKKLHNLIVLRFIAEPQQSKTPISKALHIARDKIPFENTTKKAIDRLLTIAKTVQNTD